MGSVVIEDGKINNKAENSTSKVEEENLPMMKILDYLDDVMYYPILVVVLIAAGLISKNDLVKILGKGRKTRVVPILPAAGVFGSTIGRT